MDRTLTIGIKLVLQPICSLRFIIVLLNFVEIKTNRTALSMAAQTGTTATVQLLVENGALVNSVDDVNDFNLITILIFFLFKGFWKLLNHFIYLASIINVYMCWLSPRITEVRWVMPQNAIQKIRLRSLLFFLTMEPILTLLTK